MRLRIRKYVTWLLLVSFLTLGLTVQAAPASQGDISAAKADALRTLSNYMVGSYDTAGKLLKKYNFVPPPAIAQSWQSYPAIRKLEYAYVAAETASPGVGGDKLLALLSQDLAQQYESIRSHQLLGKYVEGHPVVEPPAFKNPSPIPQRVNLDVGVTAALDALSNYYVKGPLGSPQNVLVKYFNVPEAEAYQVLAQSDTHSEAFRRAMDRVPPAQQLGVLQRLTSDLKVHYEAVSYEPALANLKLVEPPREIALAAPPARPIKPNPSTVNLPSIPEIPIPGSATRATRPIVPHRSVSMPTAQTRYRSFMGTHYSSATSRLFSSMARSFRGFGGVVFGNDVKAEVGPSRLIAIFLEETATPGMVTVWCEFADGSMAGLPNVRAGDAYAAAELYYPASPKQPVPKVGEGVGLVGVHDAVPYLDCNNSDPERNTGSQFNVVMHPALANLDIGWSALVVDTAPIEPEVLPQRVRLMSDGSSKDASEAIERLFKSLDSETELSLGTWKVVDVPMTISRKGYVLAVSRTTDPQQDFPEGLRSNAFLEMRNMTLDKTEAILMSIFGDDVVNNQYDVDFANEFYRLLPILTKASSDYERMNRFAPVLAVFRWAKQQRALLAVRPRRPANTATPDAVLVYGGNVTAISSFKELDANKQAQKTISACLDKVERSPVVAEFMKSALLIIQEMQKHKQIYSAAEPESAEAKRAEEELTNAAVKLKALTADKVELANWLNLVGLLEGVETRVEVLEAEAAKLRRRARRRAD